MDNCLFENQYEVTKQRYKSWFRISQKRCAKHRIWLAFYMKAVSGFAAALCLIGLIFFYTQIFTILFGAYALLFTLSLFRLTITYNRQYKYFKKASGETVWLQTLRFGDEIEITSGNAVIKYSYDRVLYVDENDEAFFIWLDMNAVYIVYKALFTKGDAGGFLAFFNEKLGKYKAPATKKELEKRIFKSIIPRAALLFFMFASVLFYFGTMALHPNTMPEAANEKWERGVYVIAEEELPGGGVVFGYSGSDSIYAALVKKTVNRYVNKSNHSYSIQSVVEYNKTGYALFESQENLLSLGPEGGAVVYGVADETWWDGYVGDNEKQLYTVVPFNYRSAKYVLYYRRLY